MTRPKRWYLDGAEEENGIILCNSDGPYKKPNAGSPLGVVSMVSVATDENKGRFSKEEAVLVSTRTSSYVDVLSCTINLRIAGYIKYL